MTKHALRPYQREALDGARAAYKAGADAALIVCPTGGGKTLIGGTAAQSALDRGGSDGVIWLAHRTELIEQARDRLLALGIPRVGMIASGRRTINAPIQVASVQTLAARIGKGLPPGTFLVLDEAHHFRAESYEDVVRAIRAQTTKRVRILGLTATPERGDGRPMGKSAGGIFDALVSASSVRELQETVDPATRRTVLVPCVVWRPSGAVKKLSQDPVAAYLHRTPGERAFCFCANVAHAELVAESYRANGVAAATIHADTPWLLRRARIEAFRTQSTEPLLRVGVLESPPLVLCNVYTLTEGVDVPAASVCILARGCGHVGMFLQMVGRILRGAEGKTRGVLIDLRGASHKHGLPEADRNWSLDGEAITLAESEKEAKPHVCASCGAEFGTWAIDADGRRLCPACGFQAEIAIPEVQPRELHVAGGAASEEDKAEALAQLAETAVRTGKKPGWIAYRMEERFGRKPRFGIAQAAFNFASGGEAAE